MATRIIEQTESGRINQQVITFDNLPFVHRHEWDGQSCGSNWHLPPGDIEHSDPCTIGREWAGLYLEYLRQNPEAVGNTLVHIVRSMGTETAGRRGYGVGFLSSIEQALIVSPLRT